MHHTNDILNELKELNSVLADMSRYMPYHVPDGYFEGLEQDVTLQIRLLDAPNPTFALNKNTPFDVPAGYFESFAANIVSKAQEAGLPSAKEMPYSVPAGYFENLPTQILQDVKQAENKPKTISLGVRIWKQVRWAAAAVLLLGIGLGAYNTFFNRPVTTDFDTQLAALPQDDIKTYVEQHIDEFDADMIAGSLGSNDMQTITDDVSERDILNYLGGEEAATMN